jgi:ACR3 family arsenite efflux pump ArsB|tara:strand:- start:169 stop:348 length:180 start_codon:yes stop_codon:yes gene_type:complete
LGKALARQEGIMKVRPQILTGMVLLGVTGIIAMFLSYPEVAAACPAGLVALGMKLLEGE